MAPGNRHQSQSCGQRIFPCLFPRGNDCSEQKCCKPGSRRKRSSPRASNSVKQLTLSPDRAGSTKQNLSPLLPVFCRFLVWASQGSPFRSGSLIMNALNRKSQWEASQGRALCQTLLRRPLIYSSRKHRKKKLLLSDL